MTSPVVQSNSAIAAAASITVALDALPSPGNSIVVTIGNRTDSGATSVIDNATTPNTLSQVELSQGGSGSRAYIYWVETVGPTSGTYEVTYEAPAADDLYMCVMEVEGLTGIDQIGAIQNAGAASPLTVETSAEDTGAYDFVVVAAQTAYVTEATGLSNPPTSTDGYAWTSAVFLDNENAGSFQTSYKVASTAITPNANYAWTESGISLGLAIASFKATAPAAGAALVGSGQAIADGSASLSTGPAAFGQILLDDPSHAGASDQISMGTGAGTGTGDNADVAFTKLKQWAADANTMFSQLFPKRSVQTPTTGFSIAAPVKTTRLVLNPAGTLATGTITLPQNPGDEQPFETMTSQTITALTVSTADGTTLNGAPTTLAANTCVKWIFEASFNTWFRQQ